MDLVTSVVGLVVVLTPAAYAVARLAASDGSANGTFLRAHPDLGWPRGVQEDDDVRWHWDREDAPPAVRQPPATVAAGARPPVAPLHQAPVRLPSMQAAGPPAEPRIVDAGVAPVGVAPVRRGR